MTLAVTLAVHDALFQREADAALRSANWRIFRVFALVSRWDCLLRGCAGGMGRAALARPSRLCSRQKKRAGGAVRSPTQPSGLSPPETRNNLMARFVPKEKRKIAGR